MMVIYIVGFLVADLCVIIGVLRWVCRSGQQEVASDANSCSRIAVRTSVVIGLLIGFVNVVTQSAADFGLVAIILFVFLIVLAVMGGMAGEFAAGAVLWMPFYFAWQFILGFPVRKRLILSPPENVNRQNQQPTQPSTMIPNEIGTALTPLRPAGSIDIAGQRFDAVSADGKYIDVGEPVQVCGQKGNRLLVRSVTPEANDRAISTRRDDHSLNGAATSESSRPG